MRKYDKRNKMYFLIVLVMSIILIVIFSFFLNKVITNSKLNYQIDAASIMYDNDKNLYRIDEDAILKKKWNDTYYLSYKDQLINLSKNAIIYNPSKNQMNLYGRFYEIAKDLEDKVIIHDNETLVSVNESKFYKIADRKYLLIDKTIKSENNEISTNNYLIVELDKLGNALIYNNNLNMKTFKETNLTTSTYTFNIAEEKLLINNETIDLKKIIGSTNKYVKAEDLDNNKNEENNTNNSQTNNNQNIINNNQTNTNDNTNNNQTNNSTANNTTNNNQTNTNDNNNTNNNQNNNNQTIDDDTKQDIIKATKTTSIISVNASVGYINIDYVIYDPLDEYEAVFVEIYDNTNNLVAVTYFDKTTNNLVIPNLRANVNYNLVFKYSYYNNNIRVEEKFDEASVMMSSPALSLKINKITNNKIYYTIYLDKDYELDSLKVNLTSTKDNNNINLSNTITDLSKKESITGYFEYTDIGKYVTIYLSDVKYKGYNINTDVSYKVVMP